MKISKKKVISDSIFLSGGDLIFRLKGIVFIPIIISSVGIANYGTFVQILINISMIIPFCTLELGMCFYRYTSKYDETDVEKLSRDYWTVLIPIFVLSLLGGLVVYLFSPIISKYILAGSSLNSLRLSSLLVINAGLSYVDIKYIQSRKEFKLYSIYNIFYQLIPYLGFIAGIIIRLDVFFGLLLYLIIQSFLMLSLKVYVIKRLNFSIPSIKIFKKFLKYSWALLFSSITGGLLSKIDRYFIGYFLGPAAIGIYNIVYSVCCLVLSFNLPFRKYLAIYLPELWDKGEKIRVKKQVKELLMFYLILSFGTIVTAALFLKPAVKLFLNKDLSNIANFEILVFITGLGIVAFGASNFFYQIIRYKEETYLQLIFETIAVIVNILLNFLLIKPFGFIGASIATFVSYFIIVVISNYRFNLKVEFIYLIRIAIAGLIIVGLAYLNRIDSYMDLTINIIFGYILYMVFILIMKITSINKLKKAFIN